MSEERAEYVKSPKRVIKKKINRISRFFKLLKRLITP